MERFILPPVFAASVAYTDPAGRPLDQSRHYVWMGPSQDAIRELYLNATGMEERHTEPIPIDFCTEEIFGRMIAQRDEDSIHRAIGDYNAQHGECAIMIWDSTTPLV